MRDARTSPVITFLFSFLFILVSFPFHFSFSYCANLGSETDKQALLAFKSKVDDDPFGALSTWNDSVNFCQWLGVTCSLKHQRVISLNLSGQNLTGTVSPYIGNLTFLRLINLQQNNFSGNIPHEIGCLFRLRYIIFNSNTLQGQIPVNLTHCSELRILDLVLNKLEGNIPSELGSLLKLKGLGLANNYLTGPIPQSLALEYLHHHCKKPIVHCDLKPSNILLDNDMTARVGDFGLTRFIPEVMSSNQCSSVGLKGTVWYAAPEYGMGSQVSTNGDVYSYGILLLEIFTGKRPTSDLFTEGLDLHNFVKMALPVQIFEVLDPPFLVGGEQEGEETAEESIKKVKYKRV